MNRQHSLKCGCFFIWNKNMNEDYEKVWVDIPTPYAKRKSASGLTFDGKYIWVKKKKDKKKKGRSD